MKLNRIFGLGSMFALIFLEAHHGEKYAPQALANDCGIEYFKSASPKKVMGAFNTTSAVVAVF